MATMTQTATDLTSRSGSAPAVGHLALQPPPPSPTLSSKECAFAFARIHNEVCLVQTDADLASSKPSLFMAPVDIALFRHEFGTMFRFSGRATFPARDVQVLAPLDVDGLLCEEDSGIVFLSRKMTDELLKYTAPRRASTSPRPRRR